MERNDRRQRPPWLWLSSFSYNQLQKCGDTPTKNRPFFLQITASHNYVLHNSHLPPTPHLKLFLQVLSMHGLLLLATLIREGGGITSTRSWKGHLSQKLIRYSVSSTFATGCSLEKGKRRLFFWPNSSPFFFYSSSPNSFSKNSETR